MYKILHVFIAEFELISQTCGSIFVNIFAARKARVRLVSAWAERSGAIDGVAGVGAQPRYSNRNETSSGSSAISRRMARVL